MARPTIINDNIIQAFKDVLDEDSNAIILTDKELCIMVNDRLEDDSFSYSAFKDWKAFATDKKTETSEGNAVLYNKLRSLIEKALIIQKQNLFKKFRDEPHQWQKWAWIIERKFDEWNIKRKTDVTTDGEKINMVTVQIDQLIDEIE